MRGFRWRVGGVAPATAGLLAALFTGVMLAGAVAAQTAGALCVFVDTGGTDCHIVDQEPGVVQVHVIHTGATNVSTVSFRARKPDCMTSATWLGDSSPFSLIIGDSQFGATIAYNACLSSPIHVMTVSYLGEGLSAADCPYQVAPHWQKDYIEAVDCNNNLLLAAGGTSYINSSLPCDCVADQPMLSVDPTTLVFGEDLVELPFVISNAGAGTLHWNLSTAFSWIDVVPLAGADYTTVTVTVDRTGLPFGNHYGQVIATSDGGDQIVNVQMTRSAEGTLSVTPALLEFFGGETTKQLSVANIGGSGVGWNLTENETWLSATPTGGYVEVNYPPAIVTVTVDRDGLPQGVYPATIVVDDVAGDEHTIDVILHVDSSDPILSVSPSILSFALGEDTHALSIANIGYNPLQWNITSTAPWLGASPAAGTDDAAVDVTVDRTGLGNGTYIAELQINSNGGAATIPVSMEVLSQPELSVSPTSLYFDPATDMRQFTITNVGVSTLSWTATPSEPWMQVAPAGGAGDATLTVTVDRTGLGTGSYNGHVDVTSNGGSATVAVTMEVLIPEPVLSVVPPAHTIAWDEDSFNLSITNAGTGTLEWSITSDQPWLSVAPSSGSGDASVVVSGDRTGLADGDYNGTLHVTSNGGEADVSVTLEVLTTPVILVFPTTLSFSPGVTEGTIHIFNSGAGTLTWQVSPNRSWITVAPDAGTGEGHVTVTIEPDSLLGDTGAQVSVTSNGGNETVDINYVVPGGLGYLRVYADPGGTICGAPDVPNGYLPLYIVHQATTGAGAVRAAVWSEFPPGVFFLGETSPYATTIGSMWLHDDGAGGTVAFGACVPAPNVVTQINLLTLGFSPACTRFCVVPDPASLSGVIEVVDCANTLRSNPGACLYLNYGVGCDYCAPSIDVEFTTWGRVKAQFVDDWDTPEWRAKQKR